MSDVLGHKLVTTTIRRHGQIGTAWKCECGDWHPKSADAPFGYRAPISTVFAYIKRTHGEHALAANPTAQPDGGGKA